MFYDALENKHGLPHDPFKALAVPRPIGWISSVGANGIANLAPYSFFNAVAEKPHYVVIGSGGVKDTLSNIEETKEFVCNLATYDLRNHMNISSATVPRGVDEFPLAGLTAVKGNMVAAPRVKEAAAAFECRLHQLIPLPGVGRYKQNFTLIIGLVVGIHIDDKYIVDGIIDTASMKPIARLGYMDYAVISADNMFAINRPEIGGDGKPVVTGNEWDGKYR